MQKYSWLSPKITVKSTENRGKGLFAEKDIQKDELILVMGGYVFSIEDENNLNEYKINQLDNIYPTIITYLNIINYPYLNIGRTI